MKLELIRTKKTNRVAIHSTDPDEMEPLLLIIKAWLEMKNFCVEVNRRDSINLRKNGRR